MLRTVTAREHSVATSFSLLLNGMQNGGLVQPWLAMYYNPGTPKTRAAGPLS